MIPRMTTVGTLKNYRYDLNRSNNTMSKAMTTVLTRRTFNSYAEDPALATRCFQLRRSFQRTAGQLTVNDSLRHKYDVAWSALDETTQDVYAIADDATFGSLIRGLNGATASGRNALGQSMTAKAKNIVQTMNGRYGENYVFSGADTLEVPFTWDTRKNPNYIDPEVAAEKLADPTLSAEDVEKYSSVYKYVKADGSLTNDPAEAATVAQKNPNYDKNFTDNADTTPGSPDLKNPKYGEYLRPDGTGTPTPGEASQVPKESEKYNPAVALKYMTADGKPTASNTEAGSALYFRGVLVDANPGTEDGERLEYFLKGESKYLDVGLGHKEKEGEAVSSTVFDSALQGIYYLGGTGTKEITVTVGEGPGSREVTKEVPNNLISIIARMGEILQRCSNEDGSYTDEDEDEFVALAHQFEDQKDLFIQRYAELDTQTGFLRDNSEFLTDTADSLSQQFMALEDVNPAAAISDYMFARYCYDAALKVGNSVLSQSLMDYMNF